MLVVAAPKLNHSLTSKWDVGSGPDGETEHTCQWSEGAEEKRYDELKVQEYKQVEVPAKQQRYLEVLDRKGRENNLIVTGVPDEGESLDGGTSVEDKLRKIWAKVGANEDTVTSQVSVRDGQNKRQAIVATIANKIVGDYTLGTTRQLKDAGNLAEFISRHSYKHSEIMEKALRRWENGERTNTRELRLRKKLQQMREEAVRGWECDRLMESPAFLEGPQQVKSGSNLS